MMAKGTASIGMKECPIPPVKERQHWTSKADRKFFEKISTFSMMSTK
jgi:hypothetical protein